MNSVCTPSGGTAPGVGRPRVGMNLSGGDVRVVGNGDVLGDMGGQVPLLLMDGDRDVLAWADVWDGPASLCAMEPMS